MRPPYLVFLAAIAAMAPRAAHAQDSLRILRITPTSPASPATPVVVTFDHPVAPRLGASIDPASVVRILPAVGYRAVWRDPSTLVVTFDSLWRAGATYRVELDARLRSDRGLPLAAGSRTRELRIALSTMLATAGTLSGADADTLPRPVIVVSSFPSPPEQSGSFWLVPQPGCTVRDSIPLRVTSVRPILPGDPYWIKEAGGYGRDRVVDSLRRVVELASARALPFGCLVHARHPNLSTPGTTMAFRVRPRFAMIEANGCSAVAGRCANGPLTIRFTQAVSALEIRANVQVDGRYVTTADYYDRDTFILRADPRPSSRHQVTVSGALRSVNGDHFGRDTSFTITIDPATPAVGMSHGVQVSPADRDVLIRIRHVNVDSVTVTVARIADSARTRALAYPGDRYGWGAPELRWRQLVADSTVVQLAVRNVLDGTGVVALRTRDLPVAWRAYPVLALRVRGVAAPRPAVMTPEPQGAGRPRVLNRITVIEDGGEAGEPYFTVLRRTSLATHVWSADGDVRVWVTGLRDARSRPGASVRILDSLWRDVAPRATTDSAGVARLSYAMPRDSAGRRRAMILMTRFGGDVDVRLLASQERYPYARHDDDDDGPVADGDNTPGAVAAIHGAAFAERGIYRPGESVFLKGIVRRFAPGAGYTVPRGDSARWVVHYTDERWDRERIWSRDQRLGEFGTAVDTFIVPRTARLGNYTASLMVARQGRWQPAATTSFSVAEYRVPEFAVRATADTAVPLFVGDTARVAVDAQYLFGIPMQGATGRWWAEVRERSPWELSVRGLDGFSVGRSWWLIPGLENATAGNVGPVELVTNAQGRVVVPVPISSLSRPGELTFHASVLDANRQQVTAELTMPVQVAEVYAGVRIASPQWRWTWPVGTEIPLQALVVGMDGRPRSGVSMRFMALRHRWDSRGTSMDTMWREARVSTADTLRAGFTPTSSGLHELLVIARDARGREAASSVVVWVDERRGTGQAAQPALALRADKPRYDAGEVAHIRVESPDDAMAWVTLSREGILSQRMVALKRGANDLSVAIPADAIPGAELHVMALSSRPPADTAALSWWQAQTSLEVSRDSRQLRVTLTPDTTHYRPGDRVKLALRVRDAAGRGVRAEAAVWAVDQGVASLTALEKPDLVESLLSLSGSPFAFTTSLANVLPWTPPVVSEQFRGMRISLRASSASYLQSTVVTGMAMDVPAPGRSLTASVRRNFATTPFYRGSVVTDARGEARLEFTLPDNLTTFRLFAAAVTSGVDAGSGDTSIVSARTLAVRPALPRVIRDGDVMEAGAVLTQDRAGRSPVILRVEGEGVRITGASSKTDTLDGRRASEMRFGVQGATTDTAVLRFHGATATDADAVEARLPVSPAGHARARLTMGVLAGSASLPISTSEELDLLRSRMEIQLGSSPVGMLQGLAEALRLYPYYCTEQMSSGGRALVARIGAERMMDPAHSLSARDRRQLEMAVATIVARQRDDGGFGYWSVTGWTSPWLTSYALDFLVGARDVGIDVPAGALERASRYLAESLPHYGQGSDTLVRPHDALAAVLALRTLGRPAIALEDRVLATAKSFDWVDRLTLARLLAARGDSGQARRLLADAWTAAHTDGRRITLEDSVAPRYWIFRSVMRPLATLLTTTASLRPDDPRLAQLFESVLQVARSQQRWGMNTLDQSLAADAVTAMLRRPNAMVPTTVTVSSGDRVVATMAASSARADTARLPLSILAPRTDAHDTARLELHAATTTPVYYAATLYEVPRARPVRADDEGISIDRWYESYDTGNPIVSVKAGQLVRVRIRVTVPTDREFVAVEDPLPSGLEAVDLSLRTSGSLPPFQGAPHLKAGEDAEGPPGQRWLYGSWDGGWWSPWEHREIRDDRVLYFSRQLWKGSYLVSYVARATTIGTFVRPPAHVEEMYNPAVHGRSDGGTFTVTP